MKENMAKGTVLKAFSATGGFLANCRVEFAPGLNCIIGARGTCKSTLVESIRFAFDSDPERVRQLVGESGITGATGGLVRATLGAGSVRCETTNSEIADSTALLIEREVGGEPRVFLDGVREHAGRDVLHQVEIFSQGDLQLIADDKHEDLRIALVDRPNEAAIKNLKAERLRSEKSLSEIGPQLRLTRSQIATLKQDLQPLSDLREQLRQVREHSPALSPELENERVLFERRRRIISRLREITEAQRTTLEHLDRAVTEAVRMNSVIEQARQEEMLAPTNVAAELGTLGQSVSEVRATRDRIRNSSIAVAIRELEEKFEHENMPYYRLRQEQQVVNESLKQQQHLGRQVETLEVRQKELDAAVEAEALLLEKRQQARAAASRIDDEIFRLRIAEVDEINSTHGESVALTLKTGASSPRYGARLSSLLSGSRVRGQEDVAAALSETFSPSALIDIVESGSGQRFADALDRDLGQMNRVVAHLAEHPDLYLIEAESPSSRLDITLFDGGQPKAVETLSKGQKATALLPLILRPLPYPLIIDQPEDDLDNNFIFSSLVKHVESLKLNRQLIFVTHNANIPVLGGADRVIVMRMQSPQSAAPCISGTVDERRREILDLLEGGAEAFQLREQRYHDLLPIVGTIGH
jgi:hypothetical protein